MDTQNTAALVQEPSKNSKKYKILIVEDEDDARVIFKSLIETRPEYVVGIAKDGVEALEILEKEKYDMVLLDIIMPRMDGIEALKQIKENPEKYGTPIVLMLTNVGGDVAVQSAKDLKADGYIMKIETEPLELMVKIDEALKEKKIKGVTLSDDLQSSVDQQIPENAPSDAVIN